MEYVNVLSCEIEYVVSLRKSNKQMKTSVNCKLKFSFLDSCDFRPDR